MRRLATLIGACCLWSLPVSAHADPWKLLGDRYVLSCSVYGAGQTWNYVLAISDSLYYDAITELLHPPTVRLMVNGSPLNLRVATFNADGLKAYLEDRLTNWPEDTARMEFEISRDTGAAKLSFLGPERTTSDGTKFALVIDTEAGQCSKAPQAF